MDSAITSVIDSNKITQYSGTTPTPTPTPDRREAVIHLRVRGPARQDQEIEAIIDTAERKGDILLFGHAERGDRNA